MKTPTNKDVQEINMLAMLTGKLNRQQMEQRLAQSGIELTLLQHHILLHAKRHQPTNADLSRAFGLDPSTLVPTIDGLVKKGYLKRERDPQDRRRYPLHLTEKGETIFHEICNMPGEHPMHLALSALDSGELEQLKQLMRKVVLALPGGEEALQEMMEHMSDHMASQE